MGLIGHSRGGAISILSAANNKNVNGVALWASVSNIDRYSKRQKEEWRKKGLFKVLNTRTKQVMNLGIELLDDIEKNSEGSLNIENAVKNLDCPLLISHGDQDLSVRINDAEEIYSWADKSKTEFFKLFCTGHTFGIVHPFSGTTEKFELLLEKTSDFLCNNIK